MAIGTDGPQVGNWIHDVIMADPSKRCQVMDVDKPFSVRTKCMREIEATNDTCRAIMINALLTCSWITLICINNDLSASTFAILLGFGV